MAARVSWDGSDGFGGILLFQNGVPVARSRTGSNGNQSDSDAARRMLVGRSNSGTYPFDGVIDELWIYARVLDSTEVAMLHACTL